MGRFASGWTLYACREDDSENKLVSDYVQLVKKIAQHLLGKLPACVQIEDLIQAGMIGLLEAFKNYDFSKGASFETYASIRVRGSMLDEIRKGDWAPRSVHRNTRRILEAIRVVENTMGRDPQNREVAQNLNVTLDQYHQLLQESNTSKMFTLNEIGLTDEMMEDTVMLSTAPLIEGVQQEDFKKNLAKGVETLPERERLVLKLYYEEELNLREIGEMLGVSESRVSQIHSQAMGRLRKGVKYN